MPIDCAHSMTVPMTVLYHDQFIIISPPAGCGGHALFYSAHHVIINTAVGTSLCWRLTRCHRVLPSQVSYGLIGRVGVGNKYSKPFVCICKHTATRIHIWRGCPAEVRAEVGYLVVRFSWLSALHCNPCPAPCSPSPNPTPGHLMDITLRQDWSATI